MGQYLYLGTYTAPGVQGLIKEGGSAREAETRKLFDSLGGRVLNYAFVVSGSCHFIVLAELPDDMAALVPALLVTATGTITGEPIKLMSPQECDKVAARVRETGFRPPGQ